MKDLSHILKECSIKDIYYGNSGTATTYKIPIYQRNYAWERDEIFALIKDIHDSMVIDKPVYYIGTLVTFKRDENVFEVIDGQQTPYHNIHYPHSYGREVSQQTCIFLT